jgi:hypothetical protein
VTEAFSPQGELYGQARLLQVLENNTDCSAQSVLNAVLDSVRRFTDNAPPADDLTLLVLRRNSRRDSRRDGSSSRESPSDETSTTAGPEVER